MDHQLPPKDLRQLAEDWRDYRYYVLTTVAALQQSQVEILDQLSTFQRELDVFKWKIGSIAASIGAVIGTVATLLVQFIIKHM